MTDVKERVGTPAPPPELPKLGLVGTLRWAWRQLTSMKTALVLLFLLALGAVPGSLIPQTAIDPIKVADFFEAHPKLGPVYDKLGLFDVYKSPWFSAIYLLLFISLIGCVVPRLRVYLKAMRARPPKPPRNLNRLPGYQSFEPAADGDVLELAATELRRRRFRVELYDGAVAAERGYLREAGNLLFHFSLILALIGAAWGALFGYRGTVLVVVGNGFSNSVAQYDDFSPGRIFTPDDLPPFSLTVKSFTVKFQTDGPQRGAAREFNAPISYQETPDSPERSYDLRVNHPLKVDGTSVYLLGHGYAPKMTVRDGKGDVAFSGPVPFLPQDGNFSSFGVVKAPDGRPEQLGFEGYFLPTGVIDPVKGPTSVFPDAANPVLAMTAYYGRPQVETGKPQSVYQLDKTKLTQFEGDDGDKLRFQIGPGQTFTLPDQRGSITFDSYERWVKLQVGHTPGLNLALAGISLAILGLMGSLFIHPRRTWVRLRTEDGRTVVEVAGLDRGPERGLGDEIQAIADALRPAEQQTEQSAGQPPAEPAETPKQEQP
ncbi:cytochrome c biogenesis protein ResB [Kribbella sp. CA-293567]|uniref:cytochrome c biogenesis protein ResB n=1 Tax=Kribbella sp. CA-293567 TaxID=3002436 RepID=UPI0022DCF214|nr:cytochrome c biogenesis protein ResB [Kribbella sp. CA-293567]WBQ06211.1 cytochrome c biogenesis protein ResB [Kribbella sp. CA-293567]